MKGNVETYYKHYKQHPNTLLALIIGIYTVSFTDINEEYTVIVMENIAKVSKEHIIRTYDLKGSTYQRQSIPDYNKLRLSVLTRTCLKDLDFRQNEE